MGQGMQPWLIPLPVTLAPIERPSADIPLGGWSRRPTATAGATEEHRSLPWLDRRLLDVPPSRRCSVAGAGARALRLWTRSAEFRIYRRYPIDSVLGENE